MTEDELKAIEARANAATQGPWRQGDTVPGAVFASGCRRHLVACGPSSVGTIADAAFIAAARQDLPELVAEIRRLRDLNPNANWQAERRAEALRTIDELRHALRSAVQRADVAEAGSLSCWQAEDVLIEAMVVPGPAPAQAEEPDPCQLVLPIEVA